jgi:hypothetical protein
MVFRVIPGSATVSTSIAVQCHGQSCNHEKIARSVDRGIASNDGDRAVLIIENADAWDTWHINGIRWRFR